MDELRTKSTPFLRKKLNCTKNYQSPELFQQEIDFPLDKGDVFALGVILINFLTGKYSFEQTRDEEDNSKLNQKYLDFVSDPSSFFINTKVYPFEDNDKKEYQLLIDLIKGMLDPEMCKRYSIRDVLQHKWVTDYDIGNADSVHEEVSLKNSYISDHVLNEKILTPGEDLQTSHRCGSLPEYKCFTEFTTLIIMSKYDF